MGVIAPDFGNGFEVAVLSGFERRLLRTGHISLVATHLWSEKNVISRAGDRAFLQPHASGRQV